MRILSLLLLTFIACSQPSPPPPPPPAPTPPVRALITGTARHQIGDAGFADITIWRGDSSCKPEQVVARTTADAYGRYSATAEWSQEPCVIVEATAAGGRGAVSSLMRRASPPRDRIELDIKLDPPPSLTRADADALATALVSALNDNDAAALKLLAPHFMLHDNDGMRIGIEHLRVVLGRVASHRLSDERHHDRFDEFVYELTGTTGAKTIFRIQQDSRRNAFHPVIQVAARATRWLERFAQLVAANDSEKLARLLTADDIDYPVDKARRVIERYRGLPTTRPVFVGFDEERSIFRYRIGNTPIELGYGDGLLWLKE